MQLRAGDGNPSAGAEAAGSACILATTQAVHAQWAPLNHRIRGPVKVNTLPLSPPGSLSVCGPSPWPSLRVKRSRMRKAEGFSPPLCPPPPFDRVAWDQEDTAHTRHTLYIYTRRIQKEATDQVGERKNQGRRRLFGFRRRIFKREM